MAIEAVTFDLWQTLIYETGADAQERKKLRLKGMEEVLKACGYKITIDALDKAYEECGKRCAEIWVRGVDIGSREQIRILLDCLEGEQGFNLNEEEIAKLERAYVDPIVNLPPFLVPGAEETLKALKAKRYKVGLISNTGRTPGSALRVVLRQMNILNYFDVLAFSNEIRIRKPNPEIFQVTLKNLGAAASKSIHIGDDLRSDILGAKRAGMRAIYLKGIDDPYPDLELDYIIERLPEAIGIINKL